MGRPDISVRLNTLNHLEESSWINYTLTMDGVEYEGYGSCDEEGGRLEQHPFTNQVVKYVAHGTDTVTFLLTEDFDVQKPLVLSGNAEDVYVTEQPEYVESERIIMFIDEGIEIPGNLLVQMESLLSFMEDETCLSFFNDTKYSNMKSNTRFTVWGDEAFMGVDMDQKKFHIIVLPSDVWWPSSGGDMIVLAPEDIRFGDGEGHTTIHELAHAVQQRNGVQMNRVIDEGFATYMEGKVCDEDKLFRFDYDAREQNRRVYAEITAETAEKEFLEGTRREHDYLYGYWFITYLADTYGEDIFRKLLMEATAEADEYQYEMSKEEMVPIVKKVTSERVFEEFGAWFEETAKEWPRAVIYRAEENVATE